jgi:CTP synthase
MKADAKSPVISLMEEQKSVVNKGGTMRLGAYDCKLKKGTIASAAYRSEVISERHRHRYEFNNDYLDSFEKAGLIASGINPQGNLVEIVELKDHPWFVGTQFHPELKSRVLEPHPLFKSFVQAVIKLQAAKK